jgi:hypothetical protein
LPTGAVASQEVKSASLKFSDNFRESVIIPGQLRRHNQGFTSQLGQVIGSAVYLNPGLHIAKFE